MNKRWIALGNIASASAIYSIIIVYSKVRVFCSHTKCFALNSNDKLLYKHILSRNIKQIMFYF